MTDETPAVHEAPTETVWSPGAACPRSAEITALILFGATGDLTRRKLIPAIYSLTADGLLPCGLPIISIGRRTPDLEALVAEFREAAATRARKKPLDDAIWRAMAADIEYILGELDDPETYRRLAAKLAEIDATMPNRLNRLFYLAIPPQFFRDVIRNLGASGLVGPASGRVSFADDALGRGGSLPPAPPPSPEGAGMAAGGGASSPPFGGGGGGVGEWPRIVIEKPFGSDLTSAHELNRRVHALFHERQVFRMDHYLGKETVQNLLVLRFANAIFEPLWNQKYIENVQVTMAETVGLEGRGQYFDQSGTLRDVVQNHLLELLALVAMEPPATMDADAIRDEKSKLLRSIHRMTPAEIAANTVRAQYTAGEVEGAPVPGYLEEDGIAPDSQTETYAALRLDIHNWRWAGVPFYLRAGKRMKRRYTEIVIRFRQAPHIVFAGRQHHIEPNTLIMRIQPDEGVSLCFSTKQPGPGLFIRPLPLAVHFNQAFGAEPPEAYERLILDAILGDNTLFAREDTVEASWAIMTPILEAWEAGATPLATYPAGSMGPADADDLVRATGDRWHGLCTEAGCLSEECG